MHTLYKEKGKIEKRIKRCFAVIYMLKNIHIAELLNCRHCALSSPHYFLFIVDSSSPCAIHTLSSTVPALSHQLVELEHQQNRYPYVKSCMCIRKLLQ